MRFSRIYTTQDGGKQLNSCLSCPGKINRPFLNYLWPLFQSESWCSSFHMKISFDSHANEN